MTVDRLGDPRCRIYETYAKHPPGGRSNDAATGFESVLSRSSPPVLHDLASAARSAVWQLVRDCYRIALAAETGRLRGHIVTQNLTFAARKGVKLVRPTKKNPS